VEDSGIGISEDDLPRLFGEFQQIYSGSAKKYLGTGLGLALTKRIVEAQGGTVGAQSLLGRGSTFFTVLPRTTAGRPTQAASSRTGPSPPPQLSLEASDAR
jgi:signal transduction histidine kinase